MNNKLFFTILISATLAACSSSSDSDSTPTTTSMPTATTTTGLSSTPVTIDDSNAQQIAGTAISAAGTGTGVSTLTRSLGSNSPIEQLLAKLKLPGGNYFSKNNTLRTVQTDKANCAISGDIITSWNDANNDNLPDPGETVSITFNQCIDSDGTTNGNISLTVQACSPSQVGGSCEAYSIAFNMSFSDPQNSGSLIGDMSQTGQYNTTDPNTSWLDTYSMSSTQLAIALNNESVTFYNLVASDSYNFNTGDFSSASDFTLDLDISTFTGRITVDTTTPFSGNDWISANPTSGSATASGAGGSSVVLDANTGNVNTVYVTTNANQQELTWAELQQQSILPALFN